MSTDRELLELAAKANGFQVKGWIGDRLSFFDPILDSAEYEWNPLTDDGDALRLAVNIGIDISTLKGEKGIMYAQATTWDEHGRCQEFDTYEQGDDKYAATRRAIVGCAAVIGRAMP